MAELFASGRIVELILLFVVLESIGLILWRRRAARGPSARALLANLGAGAALLLALRACLAGADWPWIALWLTLALAAHAGDLWLRLRAGR